MNLRNLVTWYECLVKFWPISSSFLKAREMPRHALCPHLLLAFLNLSPMSFHPYWLTLHAMLARFGFFPPEFSSTYNDDDGWYLLTATLYKVSKVFYLTLIPWSLKWLMLLSPFCQWRNGHRNKQHAKVTQLLKVELGVTVGILTLESTCSRPPSPPPVTGIPSWTEGSLSNSSSPLVPHSAQQSPAS